MFNLISLLLTSAMLAYMLRYRVHIHVNLTPPEPPAASRRKPQVVGVYPPDSFEGDVISALINLGCRTAQAKKAAQRAGNAGSFDAALRRAVAYAREAA